MKKLALSVAVAAIAATGVQAKTVYEDDNMYLNLTGEVAFEVVRDEDKDDEVQSKTDNVDLEVKAGYTLENGVEVFGYYAFEFASWTEEQGSAKDLLKDHYVGFKKDGLTVQYGDQDYAIDDFGIGGDLDAETARDAVMNQDDSEEGGSEEVLVAKYKGDGFYVSASVDFSEPGAYDNGTDDVDDETSYDVFGEVEIVEDVMVGAGVSYQEWEDGVDATSYGAQVEYTGIDAWKLSASVVGGDYYRKAAENEAVGFDVYAQYKVNSKVKLGASVGYVSVDEDNDTYTEDRMNYFLNGNYNFTKNVDAYGEIYSWDEDGDDSQLGFVVGLSVDF